MLDVDVANYNHSQADAILPTSTENPNQQIPAAPSPTTFLNPEQREEIAREVLLEISSARSKYRLSSTIANPFTQGSSQVNTDLARAAYLESLDCTAKPDPDENYLNLMHSPMYWDLRQAFVEDALSGDSEALLRAVWRGYNAGLQGARLEQGRHA